MYGPLIYRYAREARGHGVPEVMIAVAEGGGRIRPQVSGVRALASALCIGTGGSVGREGPIVQIGSALASSLGQWVRMPDPAGLPHSQPDPGPGEGARHNGSRLHRNGDTAPQRLLRAARQGVARELRFPLVVRSDIHDMFAVARSVAKRFGDGGNAASHSLAAAAVRDSPERLLNRVQPCRWSRRAG
jgi:Voltage gated chloride channel